MRIKDSLGRVSILSSWKRSPPWRKLNTLSHLFSFSHFSTFPLSHSSHFPTNKGKEWACGCHSIPRTVTNSETPDVQQRSDSYCGHYLDGCVSLIQLIDRHRTGSRRLAHPPQRSLVILWWRVFRVVDDGECNGGRWLWCGIAWRGKRRQNKIIKGERECSRGRRDGERKESEKKKKMKIV